LAAIGVRRAKIVGPGGQPLVQTRNPRFTEYGNASARALHPENGFCPRITQKNANKIKHIEMGGHVPNYVPMRMLQMPPIREDSRDSRALLRVYPEKRF
jgi:hypothetical protein